MFEFVKSSCKVVSFNHLGRAITSVHMPGRTAEYSVEYSDDQRTSVDAKNKNKNTSKPGHAALFWPSVTQNSPSVPIHSDEKPRIIHLALPPFSDIATAT